MTTASLRPAMHGALRMSGLLRSRGVPLPQILQADLDDGMLEAIADRVAAAQRSLRPCPPQGVTATRWRRHPPHAPRGQTSSAQALVEAVPFLHDTTTKNVIVTSEGRFSGIVDVDDLCWGDPRFAPALTLAAMQAFGGSATTSRPGCDGSDSKDDRLFRTYAALLAPDLVTEQDKIFNGNEIKADVEQQARLLAALECAQESHWRQCRTTQKARSQGCRIWPGLPAASENLLSNSSLRAGFGAAIQGRMDQYEDVRPWVAAALRPPQ